MHHEPQEKQIIEIKKYANRRLYNTKTSSYITLEDLFEMIKQDIDFIVIDAKTREDLTRNVLIQIIFDQEAKGYNMLPVTFLRKLVSFYGHNLGTIFPQYLEKAVKLFSDNQETFNKFDKDSTNKNETMNFFDDLTRKNFEIFQDGVKSFYKTFGVKLNDD